MKRGEDAFSQMRKPKHRVKKSSVPKVTEAIWDSHRDQTQSCGSLCPSVHCVLPTDAAFLAREKARADAECYTAMKIAEANKVRARCARCREGTFGFRLIVWEFPVLGALRHPKAHVARNSEPCAVRAAGPSSSMAVPGWRCHVV